MCTDASGLSLIASMKIMGRNFDSTIRTLGPTNLSAIIFENNSAVLALTLGLVELLNKSSKYINAPKIQRESIRIYLYQTIWKRITMHNKSKSWYSFFCSRSKCTLKLESQYSNLSKVRNM